jgi:hypothetical protein
VIGRKGSIEYSFVTAERNEWEAGNYSGRELNYMVGQGALGVALEWNMKKRQAH